MVCEEKVAVVCAEKVAIVCAKKGIGTVHAEEVGIIGGIVYVERGHHSRIRGPNSKVKKLFERMALFYSARLQSDRGGPLFSLE